MRLFTAVEIPESIREQVRGLLDRLRPAAKLSWTRAENLHITTKFIGEWPESRLDEMKTALASVTATPFDVRIQNIDWFPNARHPRVLYVGITAERELAQLAQATEAAVAKLGVAKEDREYAPHLTLARIRERTPLGALQNAIESLGPADLGSFRATAFYLYLSTGGKYSKLAEFALTRTTCMS
jgi:RNA 2',3'-cyclic 3'-phosphodiesterase